MQAGHAVGVAAGDLLAVGALDLGRRGPARRAPGARRPRRRCAAPRPGRRAPRQRAGAGARSRGGGGPSAATGPAPRQGGALGGQALALLGDLVRQRDRRRSRVAGSSRRAPSISLGVGASGASEGTVHPGPDSPRRTAAIDLGEREVRAIAPRPGPRRARGAPAAGRPSPARPGTPPTSARRAPRGAPGGAGGPAARSAPARGRRRAARRARPGGRRAAVPPRARPAPRPAPPARRRAPRRGPRPRPTGRRRAPATTGPRGRRPERCAGRAAAASGWSSESSVAARPAEACAESPRAAEAASSATWRQRLSVPRAGAGPAAAMKGSGIGSTVAVRGYARRVNRLGGRVIPLPPPARRQPGRLVPVGRGGVRRGPGPRTGRCCCRSATPRATGAM